VCRKRRTNSNEHVYEWVGVLVFQSFFYSITGYFNYIKKWKMFFYEAQPRSSIRIRLVLYCSDSSIQEAKETSALDVFPCKGTFMQLHLGAMQEKRDVVSHFDDPQSRLPSSFSSRCRMSRP
jgi:hypothetical protein